MAGGEWSGSSRCWLGREMSMADLTEIFRQFEQHPDVVEKPNSRGEAKAWCPWHPDREGGKPSLTINVKKQIVHCFRCGNDSGGVFDLARAWGINLDAKSAPATAKEIESTYDYLDAGGELLFQVVRYRTAGGGKEFRQRRRHPEKPDTWVWNLQSISRPVLYHLPDVRATAPETWVYVVEGEKDADRLRGLGLVATTCPMGANKWRAHHTREMRSRQVAILPDNDEAGAAHGAKIAAAIWEVASNVKVVNLPDLPDKGDVSDWLDAGHTTLELDEILARTPAYEPAAPEDAQAGYDGDPEWKVSSLRRHAVRICDQMQAHGYFVSARDDAFFFDQDTRRLIQLDKDDLYLQVLLSDRYHLNRQDQLYAYLLAHLFVEAHQRGQRSLVRQFSHYDQDANVVYLDMGAGRVLKISANDIEVRDNGQDGVLFLPMPDHEPWRYNPSYPYRLLYDRMIAPVNFTDEQGVLTIPAQRTLLLLWVVSMAFESQMPTKVLAMAVGPGESGKSSVFRYLGRMLIGSEFQVDSVSQEQKGEEDFWVNLSHSFYACYDNVDQVVRWLPDALAQVATGIRRSKRQLHTTNQIQRFRINCMVAVTARTPTVSLRREDVAGRTLVFNLGRLETKRAEYEIQADVARMRNDLLSDYAGMVQRALRVPLADVVVSDPGMRMADFARVATRIGMGLGDEMARTTHAAIAMVRAAQNRFATEEDALTSVLGIWLGREKPTPDGAMDVGAVPNAGRRVATRELMTELNAIAKEYEMRLHIKSPEALGRQLRNMEHVLSEAFVVERSHSKTGNTWTFDVLPAAVDDD